MIEQSVFNVMANAMRQLVKEGQTVQILETLGNVLEYEADYGKEARFEKEMSIIDAAKHEVEQCK